MKKNNVNKKSGKSGKSGNGAMMMEMKEKMMMANMPMKKKKMKLDPMMGTTKSKHPSYNA